MNRIASLALAGLTPLLAGCAASPAGNETKNVDVIRLVFAEVWSRGNVTLIDDLYDADFVGHFPGETFRGREGIRGHVLAHRAAFPDWTESVEDTIAERDRVVVRFTSRGTNLGEFLGAPPTGKHVEVSEVAIFRLEDGKVVEQWVYPDMLSLQRQLK